MKIEEIVKTMMQGGFDSAMGGHYDKTEEENKKHQEKVYDMVVSGGVKAIQSLLNEQLEGFEEMLKKSKKLLKKSKAIAKSKKDEVLEEYFEGRIDQIDADLINLKELKNEGKEDK